MYTKESTQQIIAQILFGKSYESLTPLWQGKIKETAEKIYLQVIKPLAMMNNALFDAELGLQQEIKQLQEEIIRLEHMNEKLQKATRNNN